MQNQVVQTSEDETNVDSSLVCSSCGGEKTDTWTSSKTTSNSQNMRVCSCHCLSPSFLNEQPLDLSVHSRHKSQSVSSEPHVHSIDASLIMRDNKHSLLKVPQPSSTLTNTAKAKYVLCLIIDLLHLLHLIYLLHLLT